MQMTSWCSVTQIKVRKIVTFGLEIVSTEAAQHEIAIVATRILGLPRAKDERRECFA